MASSGPAWRDRLVCEQCIHHATAVDMAGVEALHMQQKYLGCTMHGPLACSLSCKPWVQCLSKLLLPLSQIVVVQPAKRPAATDSDGQPPKKAKSASGAGAASGNGTTPGEAPKKRGRPTNKEVGMVLAIAPRCLVCQVIGNVYRMGISSLYDILQKTMASLGLGLRSAYANIIILRLRLSGSMVLGVVSQCPD